MKRKFIGKIKDEYRVKYFFFWINIWTKRKVEMLVHRCINELRNELWNVLETLRCMRITDKLAQFRHPAVFEKYRGIHRGEDIVVVGAGPTLDAYTPIPGAIHIGVNSTYRCEKLALDYLFVQDGAPVNEVPELTNYRKGICKKFFGVHPNPTVPPISDAFAEENGAERYYFVNSDPATVASLLPQDLAVQPLACAHSVITCAFQFALWCKPRRIYLVGCDCSCSGHFAGESSGCKQFLPIDGMTQEWANLAAFAKRYHRDVEIVSINPVGLRGLFKDLDTAAEKETSQA